MFGSFIKPVAKAVKKVDNTAKVLSSLADLQKSDVLVGIPEEKSSRKGNQPTNAELAYIHTHGSPLNNIPPRPIIEPAIEANAEQIAKQQGQVIKKALDAKPVQPEMDKLGLLSQSKVKGWFTDARNNWAPNTPETIRSKGSDRPLIDSGELRNAMTYVVRNQID